MKTICIIAQFPFSLLDGVTGGRGSGQQATWLPQLALHLQNQMDFDIHWCIIGHKEKSLRTEKRWNQTFHLLPSPSVTVSMLLMRWPQRLVLRRLFEKIKPNLVHCWGTENLYGACFHEASGPSILSMQGIVTTYMETGCLKGWRWSFFRHWEKPSINKASVVTAESKWGMQEVLKIAHPKDIQKIEYGVHPSFYDVKWQPDPKNPRILFVGSLSRLKGVDILLEMLRSNLQQNWTMVFVGDGPLAEKLRSLNNSKVEVLGALKTSEVQEEMGKAWALVLPSRADTSPNVVKEARVIGLPVVCSPHGGHAEYVTDMVDGYLVISESPPDWCKVLNRIATDFKACQKMGAIHRAEFRNHFQASNTADAFLQLYRSTLQ